MSELAALLRERLAGEDGAKAEGAIELPVEVVKQAADACDELQQVGVLGSRASASHI